MLPRGLSTAVYFRNEKEGWAAGFAGELLAQP